MVSSEPRSWAKDRRLAQADEYPELAWADPTTVARVDAYRVGQGRLPTQVTRDTTALAAAIARFREVDRSIPSQPSPRTINTPSAGAGFAPLTGVTVSESANRGIRGTGETFVESGLRHAGRATNRLLSGEAFLNIEGGPQLGTMARGQLERIPGVGGVAGEAFDIGLSPATIATAGLGPRAASAPQPLRMLLEPLTRGGFGTRLAAETALGTTASVTSQELLERDIHPGVALAAGLAAGIGSVGAVRGATRGLGALADDAAEQAIKRADPKVQEFGRGRFEDAAFPRTPVRGGAVSPFEEAQDAILRGVRQEENIRRTGIAEREIAQGRGRQASGIREAVEQGLESGRSGEELALAGRGGAKTGTLRQTFAEPIPLSGEQRTAVFDELTRQLRSGEIREFDYLRGAQAVRKLIDGEGLQPAEIPFVRRLLGDEVAEMAARRAADAEPRVFQPERINEERLRLMRQAERAERRSLELQEKQSIREVEARLKELGGDEGLGIPPRASEYVQDLARVNPRGKPAEVRQAIRRAQRIVKARDEAIDAFNRADRAEIEAVRAWNERALAQQTARQQRAGQVMAARENRQALRLRERLDELSPNAEVLLRRARAINPDPKAQEIIKTWEDGNRAILDGIGPDSQPLLAGIRAAVTGNVADSYLTAALQRRMVLSRVLTNEGFDPKDVKKVSDALLERELMLHYGATNPEQIPARARELVAQSRSMPYEESFGGLQTLVQRSKNVQFGFFDVGVFGVQGMTAIRRGGIPMLVGLINRALATTNLPHARIMMADNQLPKLVQYGLDGLATKSTSNLTAAARPDAGTLLRYVDFIPGAGALDRLASRVSEAMTNIQFGTIMGGMRNAMYEGELTMLHLMGQDITNPAVRAAAARNANHATSWAEQALRKSRSGLESVAFTSAPMTRARVAQIEDMLKIVETGASPADRMLAAMMITSTVAYTLTLGKVLYDQIGVGDLIMDPSKPGFGMLTTRFKDDDDRNIVIDLIPQDSVERAFARSIREIASGDPKAALDGWGRVFVGSASLVGRIPTSVFGYGFEPGQGFTSNMSQTARVLNMAPIPPVVASAMVTGGDQDNLWPQDILQEMKNDPTSTTLDIFGISNFPESPYGFSERLSQERFGAAYSDLTPAQRTEIQRDPEVARRTEMRDLQMAGRGNIDAQRSLELRDLTSQRLEQESALADQIEAGDISGRQAREVYNSIQERAALESQGVLRLHPFPDSQAATPEEQARQEYFDILRSSKTPTGESDHDLREARIAELQERVGPEVWQYVEENTGLGEHDPRLKPLLDTRRELAETGYFERDEIAWQAIQERAPQGLEFVREFDSYYDWLRAAEAELRAQWSARGGDPDLADKAVETALNNIPQAKAIRQAMANSRRQLDRQFMQLHPDLAKRAARWGYLTLDADEFRFLSRPTSQPATQP